MAVIERPKSLTELVTKALKDRIVEGEFELGAQLSEARIARELGVSRTPVREAINRLEMEGLLIVEPQRGSFVFHLEPGELAKLCDARVCLETTAMIAAIDENQSLFRDLLHNTVGKMAKSRADGDDAAYLSLDTEFHQHAFDCSNNRFLNDAYQTIAPKMAALRNRLGLHPEHMEKSFREHEKIANAVRIGDRQLVLELLEPHIGRKEGSYWRGATQAA